MKLLKIKIGIKNSLILKINRLKKENKLLREKLNDIDNTEYIKELNLRQSKIRELTLKNKELEKELKKYEPKGN